MKKNELIVIAGQEFLFNPGAAAEIEKYLSDIRKRHRLRPSAKRSLEEALRDTLISLQAKPSTTITKPVAAKSISIVGDSYDEVRLPGKLLAKLKPHASRISSHAKKLALNRKAQTVACIALALTSTVLAAYLITAALDTDWHQDYSEPQSSSITTVIGDVRSPHWAEFPESPNYPQDTAQNIAGAVAFILTAMLFLLVAARSKYRLPALMLVVAAGTTWAFLTHDTRQDRQSFTSSTMSGAFSTVETIRTTENLDYLMACGTEINYVMGAQSGRLFYAFQDQGFTLAKELEKESPNSEPTRGTICTAYDELRRSYPDDQIVLQHFIRDINGTIRPFDYNEKYTHPEGGFIERYPVRYGFFVQTN